MSTDFDDEDGGGHPPTREQVVRIHQYLMAHNRPSSLRSLHAELKARNFDISLASVQRWMAREEDIKNSTDPELERELQKVRDGRIMNGKTPPPPPIVKEDVKLDDESAVRTMAKLVAAENTSTFLAIEENRARMALNIVVAEMMAAKKELLLLDMRGTAALIDALTDATKLSGGHSLDIRYPTEEERRNAEQGISPGGHPMTDITPPPKSAFATSLAKFREERAHKSNGNGA